MEKYLAMITIMLYFNLFIFPILKHFINKIKYFKILNILVYNPKYEKSMFMENILKKKFDKKNVKNIKILLKKPIKLDSGLRVININVKSNIAMCIIEDSWYSVDINKISNISFSVILYNLAYLQFPSEIDYV